MKRKGYGRGSRKSRRVAKKRRSGPLRRSMRLRKRVVTRTSTVAGRVRSTAVVGTPGGKGAGAIFAGEQNRNFRMEPILKTYIDAKVEKAKLLDTASSTFTKYYAGFIRLDLNTGRSGLNDTDTGNSQIFTDILLHSKDAVAHAMDFCTFSGIHDAASVLYNGRTPVFVETSGTNLITSFAKSNIDVEYISAQYEFINNDAQDHMVDFYVFTYKVNTDKRPSEIMTNLKAVQLLESLEVTDYGASPGSYDGLEKYFTWTKHAEYMTPGQSKKFVFKHSNLKLNFADFNTEAGANVRFLKGISKIIAVRIRPRIVAASNNTGQNLYIGHFSDSTANNYANVILIDVKEVYKFRNPAWVSNQGSQQKQACFFDKMDSSTDGKINILPVDPGAYTV